MRSALALTAFAIAQASVASAAVSSAEHCTAVVPPGLGSLKTAWDNLRASSRRGGAGIATTGGVEDVAVVCLQPGVHDVSAEALRIHGSAAGDQLPYRRVVWRSMVPGAAVVSGGASVTGWVPSTLGGAAVFVAPVPAQVAGTGAPIRQLWVNGTRAYRTLVQNVSTVLGGMTHWNYTDSHGVTRVGFVAGHIPAAWGAPNASAAIEFTWPIVIRNWIEPRCTTESIDVDSGNITLSTPCGSHLLSRASGKPSTPVNVEAAPVFPLAPGTFWHDLSANLLYYAPGANQSAALLNSSAVVPANSTLVSIINSTSTSHQFEGVSFQYSTWAQVNTPDGYVDEQSTVFMCSSDYTPDCVGGSAEPRGAVEVAGSADVSFVNCSFSHIGGPWALSIDRGSQRPTVQGCKFHDLGGGFLKLGSVDASYAASSNPAQWDSDALVADNTAWDMALEYHGAAGLFGGYCAGADISYNSISDAGYSGVSLGWGWGSDRPIGVGGHVISYNRIVNVMRSLRDGGGIYVNGWTNGPLLGESTMTNNWVDSDEAVFAVFYLDNGSTHWNVTGNVASNSPLAWAFYMQRYAPPAANSSISNFWWNSNVSAPVNGCEAEGCVVDSSTVVEVPAGAPWPAAAQAIIDGCGARY